MIDEITSVVPKNGVLSLFLEYTDGMEICPRFRFFSMVAGIGAIVRRNIWFQRSSYCLLPTIYPNLWVILVAPQGRGHKSSSLRIVKNFLDKLPEDKKVNILASKLTPEALVKSLSSQIVDEATLRTIDVSLLHMFKKPAQALIYSTEFGVLISRKDYNKDMIPILTDLYDCPDEWATETIMRGNQKLCNVCISLMGASTPDWLQTMLPTDAFKGGFMSRLLLVSYPETWHKRVPDPPIPDIILEKEIISELHRISRLSGEIKWNSEGKKFFEDWYLSLEEPEPGIKSAYLERKQDHLLKLAIILKISESSNLVLTREAIETALNILNVCEKETLKMVEYIATEPRMRVIQRAIEILRHKQIVSESELLDELWIYLSRMSDFDEVIKFLIKKQEIKILLTNDGIKYQYIKDMNNQQEGETI